MAYQPTQPLSLTPPEVDAIVTVRLAADGFFHNAELATFLRAQANSTSFTLSSSETALVNGLRALQAKWSDKEIAAKLSEARIQQAVDAAKEKLEKGGWEGFGFVSDLSRFVLLLPRPFLDS